MRCGSIFGITNAKCKDIAATRRRITKSQLFASDGCTLILGQIHLILLLLFNVTITLRHWMNFYAKLPFSWVYLGPKNKITFTKVINWSNIIICMCIYNDEERDYETQMRKFARNTQNRVHLHNNQQHIIIEDGNSSRIILNLQKMKKFLLVFVSNETKLKIDQHSFCCEVFDTPLSTHNRFSLLFFSSKFYINRDKNLNSNKTHTLVCNSAEFSFLLPMLQTVSLERVYSYWTHVRGWFFLSFLTVW